MSEKFWKALPIPVTLTPPGSTVVVAGDGIILDLLGWTILNFEIAGQTVYHEIGVVKDLPVEFLIGGELMKPHACTYNMLPQVKCFSFWNCNLSHL